LGSDLLKRCNFDFLSGLPIISFGVETGYVPRGFCSQEMGCVIFWGMAAWLLVGACFLASHPSAQNAERMGHPVGRRASRGAETGQAELRRAMGAVCGFVGNWHYCSIERIRNDRIIWQFI
jgi:hypothetical protein